MRNRAFLFRLILSGFTVGVHAARRLRGNRTPTSSTDGQYLDKQGNPSYNIKAGKVDWYTFIGYRMYGANCLVCHGPDGLGSSYAPSLVEFAEVAHKALKTCRAPSSAETRRDRVAGSGDAVLRRKQERHVYINPIYIYLRARSDGALGRERPSDHEPKSQTTGRRPSTIALSETGSDIGCKSVTGIGMGCMALSSAYGRLMC